MNQNYYYNPAEAGLEMLSFEDDNLSYEFDILAFWSTKDGVVYSASDSGCSCPVPFEDYTSLAELERVGSVKQALCIFDGWNKGYNGNKSDSSSKRKLKKWMEDNLCPIVEEALRQLGDLGSSNCRFNGR